MLLLATALGARGLDIGYIERIINVHLPTHTTITFTGRATPQGLVAALVSCSTG